MQKIYTNKKKCLKQKYEYNEFLVQIQMLLNELGTGLISEESKHMHIHNTGQQDLDQCNTFKMVF